MNGPGHYALGAASGLVYAQLVPMPWWQMVLVVPIAAGFSFGRGVSPDVDQSTMWRGADWVAPDELLGNGGPLQHRGITHWWGIYAVLTYLVWSLPHGWWTPMLGALLVGWWSHLLGDFLVGARGAGRGAGIPLLPWWGHIGLGAKCGGWTENTLAVFVPVAVLFWTVQEAIGGAPAPWTMIAAAAGQ